ncbi:LEAF RUST 10 DISEASE-RESISTANCE LOCUS RECEPTOR-LIKE PROTEIN KINASE-like 1.1 isoform X2 [Rhododendron vialii]|uniref:LEAF RUST 10 DISEASE-RESISTANCE LOCUS RECEPTOR-LIKE PROTEIN KINASE-like 1.1 isoform X2 n=1 Tax=Rhododendron vialii TaxID=182163 RepID=UPI00265EDBCE|nr:LEAF RUST 10 DISEASE-RESISTANCE LOCUS RECEPTOR-LIKE PROTEIN KINASE-like 1.1 isoform X2 [Rhododendron vialii]
MGFPSFLLALFLVSHLLVLHSFGFCPPSFNCSGPLDPIKIPHTNSLYGLCTVSCDEPDPKVIWKGIPYPVSNTTPGTKKINDPALETLIQSNSCDFSSYIPTFYDTSSVSFTILSPNLTIFKCDSSSPELQRKAYEYFHENHNTYEGCEGGGYTVYYSHPNDQVDQDPTRGSHLPNCHRFQLPSVEEEGDPPSDLFSLLTSDFFVEYHLSDECLKCRDDDGGLCLRHPRECSNETGGVHGLTLILGTVIPGVILLLLLILIFRYRQKWRTYISSCTIWRNSSSDLYSKEDLEEGSAYLGISVFSYSELKEATHNFDPSKELGDGGFGTVYYGKLQDGREVAVKRLYEHNYKRVAQFLNEIEILTTLRHPSLVTLYGCTSRHSRELLLVYEYIPNGTVADHIHGDRAEDHPLPWPVRMNIAIETATALAFLHASEIVHRDVKTNNILLDNNFCVKVADFGLSRLFPNDVSHVSTAPQGTPGYVDPEYHQCYQLTTKSDVYSFGVVLVELISSLPAVDLSRHRHEINLANLAINRIQNGAFNELIDTSLGLESDSSVERMTTSVAEVAFQCLQLEKEMRPSMNEVLEALKKIQEHEDEEIEKMPSPSPDGDNVELLKSSKVPPSPGSVTDRWVSSSNTTISGE